MEEIVKAICIYILNNINDEITIEKIEKIFSYNKFYLIRAFKSYTGYTIKEFANSVRVLKTIDPLVFTDDTILKIALNNGFNSQEYYSEKFKDVIGISPLKFRREYNNIDKTKDIDDLKLKRDYLVYLNEVKQQLEDIPNNLNNSNDIKKIKKIA